MFLRLKIRKLCARSFRVNLLLATTTGTRPAVGDTVSLFAQTPRPGPEVRNPTNTRVVQRVFGVYATGVVRIVIFAIKPGRAPLAAITRPNEIN